MSLTEDRTLLTATGSRTTAGTTVLVAAPTKQYHWRSTSTAETGEQAEGTHSTTTLQQAVVTLTVDAWKGYRISKKAASGGAVQQSEVASNDASTYTFSPAMGDAPVDGDLFTLEPPVGYRPEVRGFTVSWGDDWAADGTITLTSTNSVTSVTTTLETFQVAAGAAGSVSIAEIQRYAQVHGNLQFTTSQNGSTSVEVEYVWSKTGLQLQYS